MPSMFFFLLGIVDAISAIVILTGRPILGEITKYVGIALLLKGLWTCMSSVG